MWTNRSNAIALLTTIRGVANANLQFCGDIIIQAQEQAARAAVEASSAVFNPYHRVLFASGTSVPVAAEEKQLRSAGAAVVYNQAEKDTITHV